MVSHTGMPRLPCVQLAIAWPSWWSWDSEKHDLIHNKVCNRVCLAPGVCMRHKYKRVYVSYKYPPIITHHLRLAHHQAHLVRTHTRHTYVRIWLTRHITIHTPAGTPGISGTLSTSGTSSTPSGTTHQAHQAHQAHLARHQAHHQAYLAQQAHLAHQTRHQAHRTRHLRHIRHIGAGAPCLA